MKIKLLKIGMFGVVALTFILVRCNDDEKLFVQSPGGGLSVEMIVGENGLTYKVFNNTIPLVNESALGIVLPTNDTLGKGMEVVDIKQNSVDTTWEQPWGEKRYIRNNYNELYVYLQEIEGLTRKMNIIFRVFDDGIGFRYEIPAQENIDTLIIMDELTEFAFEGDHKAWWIPAYRDNRYEYLYKESKISEMDTVHTPLTMETEDGICISIHEANLTNYASMTLASDNKTKLKCDLVPWSDGVKVKTSAPMVTPWRTIQIADNAGGLITSYLILNLNEPCELKDISWIKPVKYMGIWWAMHIGKYTFWESKNQGATTEHAKMYMDFAAKNSIHNLLIEGWNKGWTPEWYLNKLHVFSFTECADGFDFDEVIQYGKEKGVNLIGYHETGSNIDNYLVQIDSGMAMYKRACMHSIKIGQVGSRLQMKEWHHGQYGVNYYRYVLEKAAQYQLAVNFHEPIKPTGLRRTLPNLMAGEGARGQEYNAWSEGNPPEHLCILPFTRLIAGPMDFTPGIFSIKPTRVHTTLAKQLALYVIIYSPVQMLADLPENYEGHPAFEFLKAVPVDWDDTKVLNAEIGDFVTIARKDRNSNDWYIGSITDENERDLKLALSFLDEGKQYKATIYSDGRDACFDKNPESYKIDSVDVNQGIDLYLHLAPGGGAAIQIKEQ
ncbi:MAG: glycoside hydrolase family 97 protein [Bacteroidales bacterium]|nr:glycoside hydrolase family 97 protein [Bacteroidales bacterium]